MKKIAFIGLFIVLFDFWGFSQQIDSVKNTDQTSQIKSVQAQKFKKSDYSALNLQQASIDNLNLYLEKARGRKTTGIVMTIAGPALAVVGVGLALEWEPISVLPFFTGVAATAVGIPILVSGSHRVKMVNNALVSATTEKVNISDGSGYNLNQNMGKVSQSELNQDLTKAHYLKTTGLVMTIAGPVLIVAGVAMQIAWMEGGGAVFATGLISTAAGIPILIVGSKKVNRIQTKLSNSNRASLSIAPGFVRTDIDKKIYPGATLSVSF